jgi:hypothetical protein
MRILLQTGQVTGGAEEVVVVVVEEREEMEETGEVEEEGCLGVMIIVL